MKVHNFQGDLTNASAKTEPLHSGIDMLSTVYAGFQLLAPADLIDILIILSSIRAFFAWL